MSSKTGSTRHNKNTKRYKKRWTPEEDAYLEEVWGTLTVPVIARKIGRSELGIRRRGEILGLGHQYHSAEWLPLIEVLKALYGRSIGGEEYRVLKKKGLPVHEKRLGKKKKIIYAVYLDEFWEWLEENKTAVNLKKFEKNLLGEEPAWVDEKRKSDRDEERNGKKGGHNASWTPAEDAKFRRLMKKGVTLPEAAAELRKKERALIVRRKYLGIEEHFVPQPRRTWTPEEVELMLDMKERGCSWRQIGEKVGRGAWACEMKYKHLCNPGYFGRPNRSGKIHIEYRGILPAKEAREIMNLHSIGALSGFDEAVTIGGE